jgi:hypothetical protein
MSFKNHWTISSSYDFQAHQQCSQRRCWFSQTALLWLEVLPDLSPVLPGLSPELPGAPRLIVGAPSDSKSRQKWPPRVWYSPEIDASKFTLHIISDTPGGFQCLKYILLMYLNHVHKVCAKSYVVGYMEKWSMTVIVQAHLSWARTAWSNTYMTSLT